MLVKSIMSSRLSKFSHVLTLSSRCQKFNTSREHWCCLLILLSRTFTLNNICVFRKCFMYFLFLKFTQMSLKIMLKISFNVINLLTEKYMNWFASIARATIMSSHIAFFFNFMKVILLETSTKRISLSEHRFLHVCLKNISFKSLYRLAMIINNLLQNRN